MTKNLSKDPLKKLENIVLQETVLVKKWKNKIWDNWVGLD